MANEILNDDESIAVTGCFVTWKCSKKDDSKNVLRRVARIKNKPLTSLSMARPTEMQVCGMLKNWVEIT